MLNKQSNRISSANTVIWFSRILRWVSGIFFIGSGIVYFQEGAWPAIIFGAIFFVTGFLKPTCCLNDNCTLPPQQPVTKGE